MSPATIVRDGDPDPDVAKTGRDSQRILYCVTTSCTPGKTTFSSIVPRRGSHFQFGMVI